MKPTSALLLCLLLALCLPSQAQVRLRIFGTVPEGSPTEKLLVYGDLGPMHPLAVVPIVDGRFDYVLECEEALPVRAASADDWRRYSQVVPAKFFAENGEVELRGEVFSEDYMDGGTGLAMHPLQAKGRINARWLWLCAEAERLTTSRRDSLMALAEAIPEAERYSPQARRVMERLEEANRQWEAHPDSLALSQRRIALFRERDSLEAARLFYTPRVYEIEDAAAVLDSLSNAFLLRQAESDEAGVADLYNLYGIISWEDLPESLRDRACEVYAEKFRERFAATALGKRTEQFVLGRGMRVGAPYADFTLPDADGRLHRISDFIAGRVALLDFWASHCAPCRVHSRGLIPLYEEFRDRGLVVLGIAREYENCDNFRRAVAKDGYPWQQLVELDDAHRLFARYGLENVLGATILIGKDGRVASINPSDAELRALVLQMLGESVGANHICPINE